MEQSESYFRIPLLEFDIFHYHREHFVYKINQIVSDTLFKNLLMPSRSVMHCHNMFFHRLSILASCKICKKFLLGIFTPPLLLSSTLATASLLLALPVASVRSVYRFSQKSVPQHFRTSLPIR